MRNKRENLVLSQVLRWDKRVLGELIDHKDGGLLEEVAFIPLGGLLGMVAAMPVRCLQTWS